MQSRFSNKIQVKSAPNQSPNFKQFEVQRWFPKGVNKNPISAHYKSKKWMVKRPNYVQDLASIRSQKMSNKGSEKEKK